MKGIATAYKGAQRNKYTTMKEKKNAADVQNIESTKAKIESGNELTDSQVINAYLANHAVEHYCAAMGADVEEVTATLNACEKEQGVYWYFTCPAIGGNRADGTPNPTREEWEEQNKGAVCVGTLNGKLWYKRPFVIGDARGVKSIVNAANNYEDAKRGAKEREAAKIAAAAAVLGVDVDTLLALKK